MKLVWDIETDGLDYTKIWLLVAKDIETNEEYIFSDYDDEYPDLNSFKPLFNKAEALIGHNIIGFDLPALKTITNWSPKSRNKIIDTMLLSQLNDYFRPSLDPYKKLSGKGNHAMATWGFALGDEKHEDPDWMSYSVEMRERCRSDVDINIKIYRYLIRETKSIRENFPTYGDAIRLEHEFSLACSQQYQNAWRVDVVASRELLKSINDRKLEIETLIEPDLKPRKVWLDDTPREAKVISDGRYDKVTRDYFGIETPEDKKVKTYRRFKMKEMTLGNNDAVIELLLENGWEPTEWNWKIEMVNGRKNFEKRGPKLTEDSFDSIQSDLGKLIAEWRMLRSRQAFVEGMLLNIRNDGRLAADAFVIGTNTFRVRHRGIVNTPGAYAPLGEEVRSLFTSPNERVLVSADSDGNQLRGFCHYLDNPDVTKAVAFGDSDKGTDIHTRNAEMVGVARNIVKNLTYALLFGAGFKKLAETSGFSGSDSEKVTEGKRLRQLMMVAYPGYQQMLNNIDEQWTQNFYDTGRGFITGLDGRRIYGEKYKALNSLLQAFEAVTCKEACNNAIRMIKDEKLDAILLLHYHDEMTFEASEADAQRVSEILEYSFGEFITNKYNLNIPMGGSAKIGNTWFDVH